MAAQELRWLTYLLTDLGERPRSPPVLYVDNKAMLALCYEQRLEHITKHIALCYFLARELQQRRQLRLSYVASRANTADVFIKVLGFGDHQRFCTALGLVCHMALSDDSAQVSTVVELMTWQLLCQEICCHFASWAIGELDLPFVDFVLDKEVTQGDVFHAVDEARLVRDLDRALVVIVLVVRRRNADWGGDADGGDAEFLRECLGVFCDGEVDRVGGLSDVEAEELSDVVVDGHFKFLLDVVLEAVQQLCVVPRVEQVVHVGDEQDEAAMRFEAVHPLIVGKLLEAELNEYGVEVLLPQAWRLLDAVQGLLEQADGVAVFLEGVRLLDVDDGVDDRVEEGIRDVDLAEGPLLHGSDAEKDAYRGTSFDSTSGMGLVLGGRSPVVLTGHADASWADDQATQRSSQGYTFSLGSGSVSWRATRSSSVLGSSCEAEIYAGAMAAQELRWLTYLLTDLGEQPRSPPVLYVDNKAMLALCREQRLEHRTKHIALRYFLARELQQRGQLRLAYVASEANTADVFTKALAPCDHQRFCTQLGLVPVLSHLLTS
ncbi:unnamed protein product [Closterium sp. NIES-53]